MHTFQDAAALGGRILISLIFITGGYQKIGGWSHTAAMMSAKKMPAVPFFLAMTILLEAGGGLLLAAGYQAHVVAGILGLFMIPVTFLFHNYWAFDGMERMMQKISFMKNLAIIGGLFVISAFGAGGWSLDG